MAAASLVTLSLGYTADWDFIMAIGFALGAVAGGTTLWLVISNPREHWSCCDILAGSTILSYFIGSASSMAFADSAQLRFWNITKDYDLTLIFSAAIYLGIFAMSLHICGSWERRFWRPVWPRLDAIETLPSYLAYFLILIGAAQISLFATGRWSFGGFETGAGKGTELDPFTALVVAFAWPVAGVCAFVLGKGKTRSPPLLYMTSLSLMPLELVWSLANGRRTLVFHVLTMVACYLWASRSKAAMRLVIVLGLIGGPAISYGTQLFLAIRIAQATGGISTAQVNMLEHISRGNALMSQRAETLKRVQQENLSTRTFVIGYFASLIGNTKPSSPLVGLEIAINTLDAVPRFLFPPKADIIASTGKHEELYHQAFGLPSRDEANTFATSSWVDFWIFGPLIYPPILALVGFGLARLTATVNEPWMLVYYSSYVLFTFMFVEETFTIYLLTLRTLVAFTCLAFVLRVVLYRRQQSLISRGRMP